MNEINDKSIFLTNDNERWSIITIDLGLNDNQIITRTRKSHQSTGNDNDERGRRAG